jgi:excisionase family DNA binding protein
MNDSHDPIMGSSEVADMLDVSQRTVARLAERGDLKYEQRIAGGMWGTYIFRRSAVEDYIRAHREVPS